MFSHHEQSERQLRWYGVSFSALILVIGWTVAWRWQLDHVAIAATVASGLFALVYYGLPATRGPIYRAFRLIVYPIQLVVTVTLLGIVYFGVVAPIGICLRLNGHDPLQRKDSKGSVSTYWVKKDPTTTDERYFKTY